MSDLDCLSCSERLEFRIGVDGSEQTICKNCNPEIYAMSLPAKSEEDISHLTRGKYASDKQLVLPPFRCPSCGAGPDNLSKLTQKTNECESCGLTYMVFD